MKEFNITVNGKTYNVEVEEVGKETTSAAPVSRPKAAPRAAAPTPPPAQAAKPAPAAADGEETITAPMPGKVLKLVASEGQEVQAGDVILILEAMKMENEIVAPTAGKVTSIQVAEGASVNTGDVMALIG